MTTDSPSTRLTALRKEMGAAKYDGLLVPMNDMFMSEYPPASSARIAFLSGFTGSAGMIIVLKNKAAFFTDGRYTLQASRQINKKLFTVFDSAQTSPSAWLAANTRGKMRIGFDPHLHTPANIARFKKALDKTGATLVPCEKNLVDKIWHNRPAEPSAPVEIYPIKYAGMSSQNKRKAICATMKKDKIDATIITDTGSIAWLLNIRGGDIPCTPVALSYAILHSNAQVDWFIEPRTGLREVMVQLGTSVKQKNLKDFAVAIKKLKNKKTRIDISEVNVWIENALQKSGAIIDAGDDLCAMPKACKNKVEVKGMRNAHITDGVALTKFLAWLDKNFAGLDEMGAADKLAQFRASGKNYRGHSFETISGTGANGAIVHYHATTATNKKLKRGDFYLLDSGGQYVDGTTDVTRTIALGKITDEMRDRFTRVLKGHIALARIRFPAGITGAELDVLARQHLWAQGLDYNHGTGHGVGCYLGVHEGPQGISRHNNVALHPGMVVSNEPGYYKAGEYGIRIENLQVVVEVGKDEGGRQMLGFETLTLAPIDLRAVDFKMLTHRERAWIENYHARILQTLNPFLDNGVMGWMGKISKESNI